MARLDLALGPDDASFRDLVIGEMVKGIPIPPPLADLHEQLLTGTDPVVILAQAFANQAESYAAAAARATATVAQLAIDRLFVAGGEAAVADFLHSLQDYGDSTEPGA